MVEADQAVIPWLLLGSAVEELDKLAGGDAQIDNPRGAGIGMLKLKGPDEAERLRIEADGNVHVLHCYGSMRNACDHFNSSSPMPSVIERGRNAAGCRDAVESPVFPALQDSLEHLKDVQPEFF